MNPETNMDLGVESLSNQPARPSIYTPTNSPFESSDPKAPDPDPLLDSFRFNAPSIHVQPRSSPETHSNTTFGIIKVDTGLPGPKAIGHRLCVPWVRLSARRKKVKEGNSGSSFNGTSSRLWNSARSAMGLLLGKIT